MLSITEFYSPSESLVTVVESERTIRSGWAFFSQKW